MSDTENEGEGGEFTVGFSVHLVNEDGAPVKGGKVYVKFLGDREKKYETTDADGHAYFVTIASTNSKSGKFSEGRFTVGVEEIGVGNSAFSGETWLGDGDGVSWTVPDDWAYGRHIS